MSKIGKQPINLPSGVTIQIAPKVVKVIGPKATLSLNLPQQIEVKLDGSVVTVERKSESKPAKAAHGATKAQIANMVIGVVTPYIKEMEIRGTGYKFQLAGNKLTVLAGYIHPVFVTAPEGVTFNVPDESKLSITGSDKIVVGQVASTIRKIRKPEVYKGKGIRYLNEFIKLKPGKAAKAGSK